MRTLDRYLAGIFLKNFLLAITAVSLLFAFQEFMSSLLEHVYPPEQLIYWELLNLPMVVVQMTPPAVMLATVLTLASLTRTNELVAAYSIGIGLRRISALLLSLVFIISCLVLIVQDRIIPPPLRDGPRTNGAK